MTDIVLKDIDPVLAERIRRIAHARGWNVHDTLFNLIEQGLFHCESEVRRGFDTSEVDALTAAINALRDVPAGKGFS
ncbi:MAG TPA: hypothetical protein VM469_04150 [Pseudoxanthomonas sp.]|nr:hypothetical protein [Pseudoxanthomonas sp.]